MSPEKVAILVVAGLIAVLLAVALLGTEPGATPNPNGAASQAAQVKAVEKPKPKQLEEYTYTDIVKGGARNRPEPRPQAESQPSGGAQAATTEYVIRSGDTIDRIARRELGGKEMAPKILALNKGLNPSKLKIGTKILLPVVAKETPALVAQASPPKTGGGALHKRSGVVARASKNP
jgi:LysM repeat protein